MMHIFAFVRLPAVSYAAKTGAVCVGMSNDAFLNANSRRAFILIEGCVERMKME